MFLLMIKYYFIDFSLNNSLFVEFFGVIIVEIYYSSLFLNVILKCGTI